MKKKMNYIRIVLIAIFSSFLISALVSSFLYHKHMQLSGCNEVNVLDTGSKVYRCQK